MKHFFVLSLFFLLCVNTKGNTLSFETILYSRVTFLQNVNQDSIVLSKTMSQIKGFAREKKYDSAIFHSKKLLGLSKKFSDSIYMDQANFRLGYYYKTTGSLEKAFAHYNDSFKILRNIGDSISAASRLASMANIQKGLGDYVGSKITAVDGLNYLKNELDFKRISSLEHIISVCFRELKDYDNALNWNKKALLTLKKITKNIPYTNLVVIKNTKANILSDQKKYIESISILSELLVDPLVENNQKEYARVLSNLGYIKWLENKNNSISDSLLRNALLIREQIGDSQGLIASSIHLTKYYFDSDKSKALSYAEYAYSNAKKRNSLPAIIEALGYVFQLKNNINDEAKVYHGVNEKLKSINQKNRETYAVTKFENNKLVEENSQKDKQVLIQKNQKTKYLLGLIVTCLMALLGAYLFIQRSKRLKEQNKTAKLEATYETEANLSRKLHDDFGGKLNHAMVLLQSEANNEEVLDIVDGLYNQSRDFSREINDVDTGPNFKNFLFGMMGSYCKNTKLMTTGSAEVDWLKLSPLSKKTLFKVLQELMINMQKHSDANLVSVVFEQTKKKLKVAYADDGAGASTEELNLKNGLWNTEKRIEAIGGTIIFDSEKGSGFQAQIELPN